MSEKFSLKDELFNPKKVKLISNQIKLVYSEFNQESFEDDVIQAFDSLELKERIYHIRDMFYKYLPKEYEKSLNILINSLPPELDNTLSDDDFGDFIYAPHSDFVSYYGCNKEHLDISLQALGEITKRFSVEFSIRSFINEFETETLEFLHECSTSTNYHQRRLSSEGTRPKLPWAKNININHDIAIKLLNKLFYDNTRYVTRSVANHLNDISKIDPKLVIDTLKSWKNSNKQNNKEMDYITAHSLRTLVKIGNKDALELLGFNPNPEITVENLDIHNRDIFVGEALIFSFDIHTNDSENLLIDYIIHFKLKNNKYSPKVHKIKNISLKENSSFKVEKKHLFKNNMSTRKFNNGIHKISIQINGKVYLEEEFNLKVN
ncbi:MAG: DNA alkylation repair enzyme [uncultured Campylobacterales bacterium]|uniref:DNA alkylation repair enzyme n=1 Tax=uncultured Campylobacterales bacterium TaxID=352960 RepID=A0A6S6SWK7_9BACT|nr:MAG: DNA alkylation repair enzyme [uncultured Campylobacterales bacterium]